MITLAALTAQLQRQTEIDGREPVIIVDTESDVDAAVAAALQYFDADDARAAVVVRNSGGVLGRLSRVAAYTLPPPAQYQRRTVDVAGRAQLPGEPRWEVVVLSCPRPDCTERLGLVLYAAAPARCPAHPDTVLVAEHR